jgi:hypothetical protein
MTTLEMASPLIKPIPATGIAFQGGSGEQAKQARLVRCERVPPSLAPRPVEQKENIALERDRVPYYGVFSTRLVGNP